MDFKRNHLNWFGTLLLALIMLAPALSQASGLLGGSQEEEFLPAEEAFQLNVEANSANQVNLYWNIADGYYLYRDRITVSTDDSNIVLGEPALPKGKEKYDEFFGDVEIYEYNAAVNVPVTTSANSATITVSYQGCAHAGLCYPPIKTAFTVDLPQAEKVAAAADAGSGSGGSGIGVSEQGEIASNLAEKSLGWTVGWFFLAGLLLALTPCVFPMIPILSSIIAGQGEKLSAARGFSLSLVYVLAMASTYTIAGIIVGITGANLQIWFQNPWVISSFALVFVALSLSMFGLYELQMPAGVQSKLNSISGSQQQGSFVGTAVMGFLSALIVGPCVTAPLIGALLYIAETGDPLVGGIALFSLSIGMGIPLLLVGTSAGKYLPRAGTWMEPIKAVFGVMLLALAIWFLDRIAPRELILALSGGLLIGCAVFLGAFIRGPESSGWLRLRQAFAWVALVYGSVLLIGASAGSHNLLKPLSNLYATAPVGAASTSTPVASKKLDFQIIKGLDGLEVALQQAKQLNKPVLVDTYADWCIACKELEAFTFTDPAVQQALNDFVLLKADVTANDEQDKAFLKEFGIFGPPALLFFEPNGVEKRGFRVVGFIDAANFEQHIYQFSETSSLLADKN